jgi:hypothetical protein
VSWLKNVVLIQKAPRKNVSVMLQGNLHVVHHTKVKQHQVKEKAKAKQSVALVKQQQRSVASVHQPEEVSIALLTEVAVDPLIKINYLIMKPPLWRFF